tara:strand:- start:44 stop:289 length:246 start_codon:yes stop_codon:yes gene_type:complete
MSKIPKWFRGEIYKEGATVRNRFSGEKCKLNAEELSIYDFIMGAQIMMEMGMGNEQSATEMRRSLDWFRKNNAKAYITLLD